MKTEDLYQCCPACDGTKLVHSTDRDLCWPCHCTHSKTPGFVPVGVTVGQLNRMANLERALAGDPAVPGADDWLVETAEVREDGQVWVTLLSLQDPVFRWTLRLDKQKVPVVGAEGRFTFTVEAR